MLPGYPTRSEYVTASDEQAHHKSLEGCYAHAELSTQRTRGASLAQFVVVSDQRKTPQTDVEPRATLVFC